MTGRTIQATAATDVDPGWPSVAVRRGRAELRLYGLDPDEYVFRRIRDSANFYESVPFAAVSAAGEADGVVVDVGANIGNHTVFFAGLLGARVVAVEPEARNERVLRANATANGLGDRVEVHRVALGESAGSVRLVQRVAGNAGTWHTQEGDGPDAFPRVRVDDLAGGLRGVAVLKVDVEAAVGAAAAAADYAGDEVAVLRGGMALLERERPVLCVETHGALDYRETVALLRNLDPRLVGDSGDDVASELAALRSALLAAEAEHRSRLTRELGRRRRRSGGRSWPRRWRPRCLRRSTRPSRRCPAARRPPPGSR